MLTERAKQLLGLPREKRLPFLVQEIKRFVARRKANELLASDPEVVARAIRKERPAMVEVILRALPGDLAKQVREKVGLQDVPLRHEVHPDVLAIIRWKLEGQLASTLPRAPAFSLGDLVSLPERALLCLADLLGARTLGPVLAAAEQAERDAFLERLPVEQRQLAQRAIQAAAQQPRPADPQRALALTVNGKEPRRALRVAGIRRIACALLSQSAELAARVIEAQHNDFGRHLAACVSEERRQPRRNERGLKSELAEALESLAASGIIDRPLRLKPPEKLAPAPRLPPPPRKSFKH